jgi:hypothetical protein
MSATTRISQGHKFPTDVIKEMSITSGGPALPSQPSEPRRRVKQSAAHCVVLTPGWRDDACPLEEANRNSCEGGPLVSPQE